MAKAAALMLPAVSQSRALSSTAMRLRVVVAARIQAWVLDSCPDMAKAVESLL